MKKKIFLFLLMSLISVVLVSCNKYKDYINNFKEFKPTIGSKVNNESLDDLVTLYSDQTAKDIKVLPVSLDDEFIIGMDVSSIIAVEESGGVFYNEQGQEQDVFEILKDHGVNYVRIRLWHNPTNSKGEPFGGGNNTTEVGIKIAKRAARVGMRILLDFHYSDFWADPAKQTMPRAWKDLTETQIEKELYEYTYDTLKEFSKNKVRPHMVQIGNEINNGFIYPTAPVDRGYARIAKFLKQGIKAVNDIDPKIKTVIHLAEGASLSGIKYFFDRMVSNEVNFDIIGLSYYSFWHGPLEEFEETLKELNDLYDKKIAVMEYSYGFTEKSAENANHIYNSDMESMGGYKTSMQGQASYIRDVNNVVSNIENGIGTFYWEPAWLPVKNAGWASEAARSYLVSQGDDVSSLTHVSWANQALFSYSGKVLPTLKVFNEMKNSKFDNEVVLSYDEEITMNVNLGSSDFLPKYVAGYTNLDRRALIEVSWNEEDVSKLTKPGEYVIKGTIKSGNELKEVTLNVTAYQNFVINDSFEDGGKVITDVKDFTNIKGWDVTQNVSGSVKIENKNPRRADNEGNNNLNIYQSSDYNFKLYQTVTLEKGIYELSVWARSAVSSGVLSPSVELFAESNEVNIDKTNIMYGQSWSDWTKTTITFEITEAKTIVFGIKGSGSATSWAHFDDFVLQEKS